tara:strand:- start:4083 stop:4331 length:249 start_codon:yes stop_codon:yes gene_type:complete
MDYEKWVHIHHEYDTENQHAMIIDIVKDMNEDEYEDLLHLLHRSLLSSNERACDNKASFDCPDLGDEFSPHPDDIDEKLNDE